LPVRTHPRKKRKISENKNDLKNSFEKTNSTVERQGSNSSKSPKKSNLFEESLDWG
jgi:hypothetical protein